MNIVVQRLVALLGMSVSLAAYLLDVDLEVVPVMLIFQAILLAYVLYEVHYSPDHPLVLFSLIFFIYILSGGMLAYWGVLTDANSYASSVMLHLLALNVFLFTAATPTARPAIVTGWVANTRISLSLIYIVLFILSASYLYAVGSEGYASKSEKIREGGMIVLFGFIFYMMATVSFIVFIKHHLEGKRGLLIMMLLAAVFFTLPIVITGERNITFKFILGAMVVYQMLTRRIKAYHFISILVLGFVLAPLTLNMKMSLTSGYSVESERSYVERMLFGEFKSSVRNTAILLDEIKDDNVDRSKLYFINDLYRAISPGFLVGRSIQTTAAWFNETYFTNFYLHGGGVGFSQVAVGYLNAGVPGVMILFGLLGFVLRILYAHALRSAAWLAVYAGVVSVFCATIRYDLAAPVSQTIKHIIVVIGAVWFVHQLLVKKNHASI